MTTAAVQIWRRPQPVRPALSPWSYKLAEDVDALDLHPLAAPIELPDAVNESEMSLLLPYAASINRDRVGDFAEVDGIRTDSHRFQPICYLDHGVKGYALPIGKTLAPDGMYTGKLDGYPNYAVAKIYFSQHSAIAEQVFALCVDDVLGRAGSFQYRTIRFNPIPADPKAGIPEGKHLIETELLELGPVGIPCNQDAARKALGASAICGKALAQPLRAILEPFAGPARAWSPGASLPSQETPMSESKAATPAPAPAAANGATGAKYYDGGYYGRNNHDRIPHGAKALARLHCGLKSLRDDALAESEASDHDDVKSACKDLAPALTERMEELKSLFRKAYPDLDGLDGEPPPGDTPAAEQVTGAGGKGLLPEPPKLFALAKAAPTGGKKDADTGVSTDTTAAAADYAGIGADLKSFAAKLAAHAKTLCGEKDDETDGADGASDAAGAGDDLEGADDVMKALAALESKATLTSQKIAQAVGA